MYVSIFWHNKSNVGKATGSDGVSAFFLKTVACEIAEPLTLIFNESLVTGSYSSICMEVL